MYFKRLEMLGFKSFVEYTCLDFESGVSAIVGPNGCGKSNVVDAIRWVLGEQSAKALRGSRMEDVIFNGTDQQKALGMAEVSLTIDNQDHQLSAEQEELTITRRTYRSGESEYLLNKVPCRLRDIHDLISDTGLGTNAYSFLEQGKIDLIVSSRPADRRAVFEDAAGISKYKNRKEESLRKLEATEQNLLRVNDIAAEVKRQINSLERQAQKARRYQDLKQELTTLEVAAGRKELRERRNQLLQLEQTWERASSDWQALEEQRRRIEEGQEAERREGQALDEQLVQDQLVLQQVQESLIKAEDLIASSGLRLQDLERELARWERELQDLQVKQAEAEQRITQTGELHAAGEQELAALVQEVRAAEETVGALEQGLRERALGLQDQQEQLLHLVDRIAEVKGNLKNLDHRQGEHAERLSSTQQRLLELLAQQSVLGMEQEQQRARAQELQAAKTDFDQRAQNNAQERERVQNTQATLQTMLENFTKTRVQIEARLKWIEELRNGLEGYEQGAKTILLEHHAAPGRFAGILGPVANFLRTDPQFELALEAYLGHRLQYILVNTSEEAQAALDFLSEQNRGRATFIPWEAFLSRRTEALVDRQAAWFSLPGVLGCALDLAKLDERYRELFASLLGHVVLVKDLETLRAVRQAGAACTLVTLQGEIDTAEGFLTGGNQDLLERGLLGRERELEELNRELASLELHIGTANQELALAQEKRGLLDAEAEHLQQEAQTLQLQSTQVEKHLERLTVQLEELGKQTRSLETEKGTTEDVLHALQGQQEATVLELQALEGKEQHLQISIQQVREAIAGQQADYERLQERMQEMRVRHATRQQQQTSLAQEFQRLQAEREDLSRRRTDRLTAQAADQQRRQELQAQVLAGQEAVEKGRQDKILAESAVAEKIERRQALQLRQDELNRQWREIQQQCDACKQQQHHCELEKQQAEYRLRSLEDYLSAEYKMNLSPEADLPVGIPADETAGEPSEEAVRGRITELKEKLNGMGSVNLVAMEEYQELQQRHAFLDQQLSDLRTAKDNLHRLIAKINQESRQRFSETFLQIKERFREVFRHLFNGGDADLILLDENDLLESGIEIIARPPGKRLQNITLLSGGEKALTAIALLFAVFLIKPSPFCIFDEMDAPLDDNNTLRFARILQEFAARSQFIVITHNKITMEKADIMYGVTMQEPGVSKIISVKFKGEPARQPVRQAEAPLPEPALN